MNSFLDLSSHPLSARFAVVVELAFTQSRFCYFRPFLQLKGLTLLRLCEPGLLVCRGLGYFHLCSYLENSSGVQLPVWFYFRSLRKERNLLHYRLDSRFSELFILDAILVQSALQRSWNPACGTLCDLGSRRLASRSVNSFQVQYLYLVCFDDSLE